MNTQKSPVINTTWQKAASFAVREHRGQTRGDGKTPYVAHPVRVALTILTLFDCDDSEVIAAALLHDVIEKAGATFDELSGQFGPTIATMVASLSKDCRLPAHQAEKAYLEQLRHADWKTRLVKLADVYDNLREDETGREKRKSQAQEALALASENEPTLLRARRVLANAIETIPA